MSNADLQYLKKCLLIIERQLKWGKAIDWKQRDFEALSDRIYEKTGVQLSLSTLKRLWQGNYRQLPQPGTLNALAQFVEYRDWQEFKAGFIEEGSEKDISKNIAGGIAKNKSRKSIIIIGFAALLLFWILSTTVNRILIGNQSNFDTTNVYFEGKRMSDSLPNTVIFGYKLPLLGVDSAFVQQSWDKRRRTRISLSDSIHTSLYYYPGYFQAKLVANNTVLKEWPLHITTNRWQAMATKSKFEEVPIYIPYAKFIKDGHVYVSPEVLKDYNAELRTHTQWVNFIYSNDFKGLNCSNFELETRIKNALDDGALTCQESHVKVGFEMGRATIPLCVIGCVNKIDLYYSDYKERGKSSDLSAMGVDMNRWVKLRIRAHGNNVNIFINDSLSKIFTYSYNAGEIKYLHYRFRGCGMVDYVTLKDTVGDIKYHEDFN
ncbi:MAG: hypothetical protein MI922_19980 [Bacteroidales bacterium]|nr:hypothetical protein [Bacteroidales bacterium]